MFENTLSSSWNERSRRGLTTLTSLGLQVLAVGVLLMLPLLRPSVLPLFHQISTPVSLGQPLGEPPTVSPHAGATSAPRPTILDLTIRMPSQIPNGIPSSDDGELQITGPGSGGSGIVIGDPRGLPGLLPGGTQPVVPAVAPPAAVAPVRISHMSEGDLVHKVLPTYPPLARAARVQGRVLLQAVISKEGMITNLRVLAGHPMLVKAALAAVQQWRYRPYILNNEPVEVETQITVNFGLDQP